MLLQLNIFFIGLDKSQFTDPYIIILLRAQEAGKKKY